MKKKTLQSWFPINLCCLPPVMKDLLTGTIQINEWCRALTGNTMKGYFITCLLHTVCLSQSIIVTEGPDQRLWRAATARVLRAAHMQLKQHTHPTGTCTHFYTHTHKHNYMHAFSRTQVNMYIHMLTHG